MLCYFVVHESCLHAIFSHKLSVQIKPWVRIAFPEFRFGSGLPLRGSDSDRFRRARFGFELVSPGQDQIRIGFAGPDSDSDRFRWARFGLGSDSALRNRVWFGFRKACGCMLILVYA